MSRVPSALVTCLSIAVLSLVGCASRPVHENAKSSPCRQPGSCTGGISAGAHAYQDLTTQHTKGRDLSLPPKSLTTVEALTQSADVKAALARSDAAYSEIDTARAMTKPRASLDASGSFKSNRWDPFTGIEPDQAYSYALTVDIPLYQGGRDKAAMNIALSEFDASVESAKDQLISTALSLVSAQAQIRRQTQSIAIMKQHRSALQVLRGNVVGERDAGTATAVDIGDVDRQLLRIEVEQKQALLQRAEAEQTLVRLNMPKTSKDVPAPVISGKLPDDLPGLVKLALRNNPRIATRLAQMNAAEARVAQAKSAYNPDLSLALSAAVDGVPTDTTERENEVRAFFRFSVPLYSGGAREAGIQGRKADLHASALEKDSAVMGVYAAVTSAFDRQNYARQILKTAQRELSVAQSQITRVKAERKLGERSVYDEIRAISDAASAELSVNAAVYELAVAQYILASETGMLADIVGVKLDIVHDRKRDAAEVAARS